LALNHPAIGWMNLNELRASLEEGQKAYDVMKAAVGDGVVLRFGFGGVHGAISGEMSGT